MTLQKLVTQLLLHPIIQNAEPITDITNQFCFIAIGAPHDHSSLIDNMKTSSIRPQVITLLSINDPPQVKMPNTRN